MIAAMEVLQNIVAISVGDDGLSPWALMYTSIFLGSAFVYFTCPSLILLLWFRLAVWWSGMRMRYVEVEKGHCLCYGEKGRLVKGQPSILLLHGFSADQYMWAPIVQRIPSSVHVVAVDLPGHGWSSVPHHTYELSYSSFIEDVHQLVKQLGMDCQRLHVVGLSMGGTLAGLFAAKYPHLTSRVTLACPSMKTPEDSAMLSEVRAAMESNAGQLSLEACMLLPQDSHQMRRMLNSTCFYPPRIVPKQILQGAADLRKKKNDFYLRLFEVLVTSPTALEENLEHIKCPAHIIWGQDDGVIHCSGIEVLQAKLPKLLSVDIIPCCGHAINIDQPQRFAQLLLQQWQQGCSEDWPEQRQQPQQSS